MLQHSPRALCAAVKGAGWCAKIGSAPTVATAAHPSSPDWHSCLESVQHLCSELWSHTAGVCTAPWGFACHTFNQLRVTSCCSIIHTGMDGCRVWMPISRAVHVQLQALCVHRVPVFSFLGYLHPLLILRVGWLNFFSVLLSG